jgi:hypothetical protein
MAFLRHSLRWIRDDYLDFSIAVGSKLENRLLFREYAGRVAPISSVCSPATFAGKSRQVKQVQILVGLELQFD